tara:strand:+ start:1503 stop:1634 length:132 start_codon:yes stop_codon:yes gene_type:complete
MTNIIIENIILEIDGKIYTTKKAYDHSALHELLTMGDLVEVKP